MSTLAMSGLAAGALSKKKLVDITRYSIRFFLSTFGTGVVSTFTVTKKSNIRTSKEIEQEKYALKLIRGDFNELQNVLAEEIENLKQAIKKSRFNLGLSLSLFYGIF